MNSLKFIRQTKGESQFQLSLLSKIPSYRLSRLETGRAEPTRDELQRLAVALGTTPEVLQREVLAEVVLGVEENR